MVARRGILKAALERIRILPRGGALIAAIKNGHTQLRLPVAEAQSLEETVPLLPLGVLVLGERIFVVRDFSGEAESLAGSEMRAINGVASPALIERLLTAVSADGDVETSRRRIISGRGFIQRLHTILDFRTPFVLSLRDLRRPSDFTLTLNGVSDALISKEWKGLYPRDLEAGNRRFFDFRFSDDGRIGIMTIPSWDDFVDSDQKTTIQEFFHSAFSAIQERATGALIMGFKGRVYVLIDGNSFSASTEFPAFLWSRRRAEFVGGEASGYWRSNTSRPQPNRNFTRN